MMHSPPIRSARPVIWLAAVFATLPAAPALAQASAEIIRESAGSYQLVPTDGRPACTIQLATIRTGPDAWRATPAACPHVPAFAKVAGWRLLDGTVLLDGRGRTVMRFVEDETALPTYPDLQAPQFYLVPSVAGFTHLPQMAEWVGSWKLQQHGKPVCTITLAAAVTAPGEETRKLSIATCPRRSAAARLIGWSREDLSLMLWGPDDALLAFQPAPGGRWMTEAGGWSLSK